MSDELKNTPEDRRTVAASQQHEVRHFIDSYCESHPEVAREAVEAVLSPSESRDKLTAAVEQLLSRS